MDFWFICFLLIGLHRLQKIPLCVKTCFFFEINYFRYTVTTTIESGCFFSSGCDFFEKAVLTTIEIIISKVSATMHRTINETVVLTGWHIRIIKKKLRSRLSASPTF